MSTEGGTREVIVWRLEQLEKAHEELRTEVRAQAEQQRAAMRQWLIPVVVMAASQLLPLVIAALKS